MWALHLEETYFRFLRPLKESRAVHRFLGCFLEGLVHKAVTTLGSDHRSQVSLAVGGESPLGGGEGEGECITELRGTSSGTRNTRGAAATKTPVAETGFDSKGAPGLGPEHLSGSKLNHVQAQKGHL